MESHSDPDGPATARRAVIAGVGGLLAGSGVAVGQSRSDRGRDEGRAGEGAPSATISWAKAGDGDRYAAVLGNGTLSTFASVTPSGRPNALGVHLTRDALTGLPSAAELEASGEGLLVHGAQSREYVAPLPDAAPSPFTFVGFYWNPEGHPPPDVYGPPHFDFHFHFQPRSVVAAIEPGTATYAIPDERLPEGYARLPNPEGEYVRVIHMGEHLGDPSAPELNGEPFRNTLIWGVHDVTGDDRGELTFVEPMVTREYLADLDGVDRRPIAQPQGYPQDGWYPTAYEVRDLGTDGVAVALRSFEKRTAE